jgi:hypothetical protein
MTKMVVTLGLAAAVACDGFGQAVTQHTDVLARAAGHELTVDQAAALVAPYRQVPAQRDVVDALANLWVDYTLLATAASQDSLFRTVDIEPLLRPSMDQWVVWKLREKVIKVDTAISDEELHNQYEQEQPGLQVRARHILLGILPDATPAQRDSVMKLAQELRRRAAGGEDFAILARAFSQDGSAQQGGDLGFFPRGQMVAPFDEASFKLQPGQISDVVETPFGLHIIKVEERRQPGFDEIKDNFRQTKQAERGQRADADYIRALTDTMAITVQEGAVENARELARNPDMQLRGRAGSRALVRYKGGTLSAATFLQVLQTWQPQLRGQLVAATDDQVRQVLEGVTRTNVILVEEARRQGLSVSESEADTLREQTRMQLRVAAANAGLTAIQPQEGETMPQAIERKVKLFLEALLRGEQQAYPLGPASFTLRSQFGGEVFDRAFDAVVARIEAQRPPPPPAGGVVPSAGDTAAAR